MRTVHLKLIAPVVFNVALFGVVLFLLTYSSTERFETPFGTFQTRVSQPYSLGNENISDGVIAMWLGIAVLGLFGNLSIHRVKDISEETARKVE